MKQFQYQTASSAQEAASLLSDNFDDAKIIAGGLDLVGELKEHLIEPEKLVSITNLDDLAYINEEGNTTQIGSTTILVDIVQNPFIKSKHTALQEAALSVGSPQIRNVGTLGGNLCQRPRCWYYRGEFYKCLKKGGALCYALTGRNKYNAILGGGPSYIVHPSDCAPALVALDAIVKIQGPEGNREMPLEKFFTNPTERLTRENFLESNEIVTEVEIPDHSYKSTYIKAKEREGYDWALSAAAVALQMDGNTCKKANIILGGVAPKPWRAVNAEEILVGNEIAEELATSAAEAALADSEPLNDNAYKVPLTRNIVKRAIMKLVSA